MLLTHRRFARQQVSAQKYSRFAVVAGLCLVAALTSVQAAQADWKTEWRKQWLASHSSKPVASTSQASSPSAASASPAGQPTNSVNAAPTGATATPKSVPSASTPSAAQTAASAAPTHVQTSAPTPITQTSSPANEKKVTSPPAVQKTTAPASAPKAAASAAQIAGSPSKAASTVDHNTPPSAPSSAPVGAGVSPGILADTKPDLNGNAANLGNTSTGDHTKDSPMADLGDSWKMLGYLVPMLLVIVGCLNLLKRFQARTGRLPGVVQSASKWGGGKANAAAPRPSGGLINALIGSFHMNNARQQAGRNIRVIESMPIGGANVHLIEVRGRVLLLGATGGGMRLLAEWQEQQGVESDDFRDLLQAAAADMDALDLNHEDIPATAMVTTLEDLMRETGESVSRRARRLRTVQEVEGEDD